MAKTKKAASKAQNQECNCCKRGDSVVGVARYVGVTFILVTIMITIFSGDHGLLVPVAWSIAVFGMVAAYFGYKQNKAL